MRVAVAVIAAVVTIAASAIWFERHDAIDVTAASIPWAASRPGAATIADDMIAVPGGTYLIGDDSSESRGDAPIHRVSLAPFSIDRHEVTNRQFAVFVHATGYVTTAERAGGGWIYRGGERDWLYQPSADWRHPLGPGSSLDHAWEQPVVLVSWYDANSYARWAGERLPTESEWEVAARAGQAPGTVPLRDPSRDRSANVWQGTWPVRNTLADGFLYTAPVESFPPNAIGLFDMLGNVWEWTSDAYDPGGTLRVARGGSWFCSANYCEAYRPGFRGKSPPDHAFNNVGFRCVRSLAQGEGRR